MSANVDAGFSIVSYTGTGANATVGHGLSVAPEMVIVKRRSSAQDWAVWHTDIGGGTKNLYLNKTDAVQTEAPMWNSTVPTSSVISLGTYNHVNASSNTYISYAFHSVDGYSKVGSYTGNGSTDGTFVHLGLRPAYVMVKEVTDTHGWFIADSTRTPSNVVGEYLFANLSNSEYNATQLDFTSNGFKLRTTSSTLNTSGSTYIYLAFAESPFKHSNAR